MDIYTTEFIGFIHRTEDFLGEALENRMQHYGNDSMIEVRNMTIGDTNWFGENYVVMMDSKNIDVRDEIHALSRKSDKEVMDMIYKKLEKDIHNTIEDKVANSNLEIRSLNDVRKVIKIVYHTDIIISSGSFTLNYQLGVGFYKKQGAKQS